MRFLLGFLVGIGMGFALATVLASPNEDLED
jgi:hypothetical protein